VRPPQLVRQPLNQPHTQRIPLLRPLEPEEHQIRSDSPYLDHGRGSNGSGQPSSGTMASSTPKVAMNPDPLTSNCHPSDVAVSGTPDVESTWNCSSWCKN